MLVDILLDAYYVFRFRSGRKLHWFARFWLLCRYYSSPLSVCVEIQLLAVSPSIIVFSQPDDTVDPDVKYVSGQGQRLAAVDVRLRVDGGMQTHRVHRVHVHVHRPGTFLAFLLPPPDFFKPAVVPCGFF